MLRRSLFFLVLLMCGLLSNGGSRMLRFSTRKSTKTGVANTASSAAFPSVGANRKPSLQTEGTTTPELFTSRGRLLQTTTRTKTTTSTSRTQTTRSTRPKSDNRAAHFNRPIAREKGSSKKQFTLASNVQLKKNVSIVPEHNSVAVTEKRKHDVKRRSSINSRKHFKRQSRKRITKELREFWDTLDQRDRLKVDKQNDDTALRNDSNKDRNTLKKTATIIDTLYEEFPFLSENYDYYHYYYDEPEISNTTNIQKLGSKKAVVKDSVNTSVLPDETTVITLKNDVDNQSVNTTNVVLNVDHKLSNKLLPIVELQGRKMPKLTAQGTRQAPLFSAPPPSTRHMTAIDNFRNRRQNEKDNNKPIDILKEFPIFRHFDRNVTAANRRKSLSLHERLQNLFTSTVPTTTTLFTTTVPKTTPPTIFSKTTNVIETTENYIVTAAPSIVNNISLFQNVVTTNQPEPSELLTTSKPGNIINSTELKEAIEKNVTFSTSKSHKEFKTSQIHSPNEMNFDSQLGSAPLGDTPFGISPFGDAPMGEKPFGLSPQGQSPLGNLTGAIPMNTISEDIHQGGVDGRYHVQVTAPDGSINGDYIVVDPVTGDVNGVRYEAAHDVDPLLVQRVLRSFLSLDPRLSTASSNVLPPINGVELSTTKAVITEKQTETSTSETPPTTQLTNVTETTEILLSSP